MSHSFSNLYWNFWDLFSIFPKKIPKDGEEGKSRGGGDYMAAHISWDDVMMHLWSVFDNVTAS